MNMDNIWNPFDAHLFLFGKVWKAIQKFSCTFFTDAGEASSGFLAMSDAMMTEAVEPIQYILHDLQQIERYMGLEQNSRQESQQLGN